MFHPFVVITSLPLSFLLLIDQSILVQCPSPPNDKNKDCSYLVVLTPNYDRTIFIFDASSLWFPNLTLHQPYHYVITGQVPMQVNIMILYIVPLHEAFLRAVVIHFSCHIVSIISYRNINILYTSRTKCTHPPWGDESIVVALTII